MIFIEGLPCAGKSILIQQLKASGESVCFELGKILHRDEFPGNGQSIDEVELINQWFIQKEEERMLNNKALFFDRSYLTHLCYAHAYSRLTSLDIFESTIKMYQKKIIAGNLPKPQGVIYLEISSAASILRQKKKISDGVSRGLPDFWRNQDFLNDTLNAYQKLFSCFNGISILSISAELSTNDKLKQIKYWLVNLITKNHVQICCDSFIKKISGDTE